MRNQVNSLQKKQRAATSEKQYADTASETSLSVKLFFFLSFLIFFIPAKYSLPSLGYTIWRILVAAASGVAIILFLSKNKLSLRWVAICFLYLFCMVLFPILNKSSTNYAFGAYAAFYAIGFTSLLEYGFDQHPKESLTMFALAGFVMCVIHLISVMLYWNVIGGMQQGLIQYQLGYTSETVQHWYFLTYDNASVFYVLPVSTACVVCGVRYANRAYLISGTTLFALYLLTFILQTSITAAIASSLLIILWYCTYRFKRYRLQYKTACLLGLSAILLLIILIVFLNQFESLSVAFGKGANFSRRKEFWSRALFFVMQNPFWGNGYENGAYIFLKIGQSHCHNIIVELLFEGGLMALLLFAVFLFSCKPASLCRHDKTSSITSSAIIAFFVAASLDWLITNPIPIALFLIAHYFSPSSIDRQLDTKG